MFVQKKIIDFLLLLKQKVGSSGKAFFSENFTKGFPKLSQWRRLPTLLSLQEKIGILFSFALIFVFSFFLLRGSFQKETSAPREGGIYREAVLVAPKQINPVLAKSDIDLSLVNLIYSKLFTFDEAGNLVPDIAVGYTLSEDKKVYTVEMKNNARFHNGDLVTADDVIFTINLIQNPNTESPLGKMFEKVEVSKVSQTVLEFKLSEEYVPFPMNLTFGILPKNAWESTDPMEIAIDEKNLKPIGSGQFRFDKLVKTDEGKIEKYLLKRNERYYGVKPYLDSLNFVIFDDLSDVVSGLEEKEIDGAANFDITKIAAVSDLTSVVVKEIPISQYRALFFNEKRKKIFQEQEVRKALSYAIPYDRIISEAVAGRADSVYSPIFEGMIGYNPEIEKTTYNLDEARKILTEAGWKQGDDGICAKGDEKLSFTITTVKIPVLLDVAKIVTSEFAKIGVQASIEEVEPSEIIPQKIQTHEYDVLLHGQGIGHDPDPYPFWHSSKIESGFNLTSYKNETIDRLLEEARKTFDDHERALKYIHFQNILAEKKPAIFLYSPKLIYVQTDRLQGADFGRLAFSYERFNTVQKWYVKKK